MSTVPTTHKIRTDREAIHDPSQIVSRIFAGQFIFLITRTAMSRLYLSNIPRSKKYCLMRTKYNKTVAAISLEQNGNIFLFWLIDKNL